MKITHLIASLAIIACTTVGWFILGSALSQRTAESSVPSHCTPATAPAARMFGNTIFRITAASRDSI